MTRFLSLFLLIFCIFSCQGLPPSQNEYYKKGMYFLENTREFENQNKLILAGYGLNLNSTMESPPWHQIHQFEVTFISLDKLNLNQARKKLINSVNNYLKYINEDKNLKPYLYKRPFTNEDILFRIAFHEKGGKRIIGKEYVTMTYTRDNLVFYFFSHEDKSMEPLYEETYQEALKILKEEEKKNE